MASGPLADLNNHAVQGACWGQASLDDTRDEPEAMPVQARFPDFDILPGTDEAVEKSLDNSKVQRELGLHLMPLATSFEDMAVTLLDLGVVKPKLKREKWQNGQHTE